MSKEWHTTILDYDYIPVLEREESLLVRNIQDTLEIEDGKRFIAPDYSLNSLSAIEAELDRLVFQGRLRYVYYQDAGDIKKIDPSVKQYLLATREGFKQYFRLGQKEGLRAALPYVPRAILKRLQGEGYSKWKAAQAMNMYIALMSQRGGNEEMAGKIIQLRQQLNEKLVAGPTMDCENDEEFFYLAGQIISYMLDRSKSQSANHSMANAFLETKRPEQLVKEIRFAFMKYNHDISRNYKKFNQAMAMVQGYICDQQKVDLAMLLTGYTASNMFYEKKGGNEDE